MGYSVLPSMTVKEYMEFSGLASSPVGQPAVPVRHKWPFQPEDGGKKQGNTECEETTGK